MEPMQTIKICASYEGNEKKVDKKDNTKTLDFPGKKLLKSAREKYQTNSRVGVQFGKWGQFSAVVDEYENNHCDIFTKSHLNRMESHQETNLCVCL